MGKLIGSVGLAPGSDSGFDLDTKGQIHGYTSTQYALPVGSDNHIIYADSTSASGLIYGASAKSILTTTGDLLYASSANTLARLAGGTSGDVLTANGAGVAPSYQTPAGGGGSMELVSSTTQVADVPTITVSFSAINQSDISYLHCVLNGKVSATNYGTYLNVNGIQTSTYEWSELGYSGGSSENSKTGHPFHTLLDASGEPQFCTFDIMCNEVTDTILIKGFCGMSGTGASTFFNTIGANTTASQTSLDEIFLETGNSGIDFLTGTRLDIFKVTV